MIKSPSFSDDQHKNKPEIEAMDPERKLSKDGKDDKFLPELDDIISKDDQVE